MNSINKKKIYTFILILGLGFLTLILLQLPQKKITFTPRATEGAIAASFNPATATAANNTDFVGSVRISGNLSVRMYQIIINFDKTKVNVKADGIEYLQGQPSIDHQADTDASIATVNQNGRIKLVAFNTSSTGLVVSGSKELVKVTFTSKSSSSYNVTVDGSQSLLIKLNTDGLVEQIPLSSATLSVNGQAEPSATSGPQPSATRGPSPTQGGPTVTSPPNATATSGPRSDLTVSLKLKFQGVLKKPALGLDKMNVKVSIVSGGNQQSKIAEFTSDDDGVWSGQVGFTSMSPRPNYKILVKGPKHIQKKICVANPTETYPGTYGCADGNIDIKAGANSFDFSNIYQLVGDLPEQDGVVNSYDTSLVVNNLGKNDAEAVRLADLNLDGVVNAQDYSLVIAALSTRADEQ